MTDPRRWYVLALALLVAACSGGGGDEGAEDAQSTPGRISGNPHPVDAAANDKKIRFDHRLRAC